MNEIVMIPVAQLEHHPENPRKDLGDLTELAESIRKNGIMQNLTVIEGRYRSREEFLDDCKAEGVMKSLAEALYNPEASMVADGKYTVVIGNRRMEAAKLAGLEALPCVISGMDYTEQISTMLEENMQRADLTPYEQAQGFQMMMDLGFKPAEIAEKTGFSEKTIKDRVKLTKLNQKNFEKAVNQGATLMDLIEITKLESKVDQNAVMAEAGTNNFRQVLTRKLNDQKYEKAKQFLTRIALDAGMQIFPKEDNYWNGYQYVQIPETKSKEPEEKILKRLKKTVKDNPDEVLYFIIKEEWQDHSAVLSVYRKKTGKQGEETEEEQEEKQKQRERQKKSRATRKLWAEAYNLRTDFVKNYTVSVNGTGMTNIGKLIVKYSLGQKTRYGRDSLPENQHWKGKYIREVLGLTQESYEDRKSIWELMEGRDVPMIRATIAWMMGGGVFDCDWPEAGYYSDYDGSYSPDGYFGTMLRERYEFLQEIGYEMSDLEKQLMDGTHECYRKGDEHGRAE